MLYALILGLQRQHPLDRAGASGPDTRIPSTESPVPGALDGSAVSGASAGASCPDTEPPKEAPLSSAQMSGSQYLVSWMKMMKLVPPESWQVLRALILGLQRQG